jgi:hypothetical protein
MKKLLFVLFLVIPTLINAQTPIPNGGMETWTNIASSTEEPTEWNSLMTGNLCGLCSLGAQQCCFRESGVANVHTGTYSAKIVTNVIFGNPANGVMTLGQVVAPSTTPSAGYNTTLQANINFSETVTSQPDSIVFWAKYVPLDATDSARISVIIHDAYDLRDPQNAGSLPHVRSKAIKNFRTGGIYVRISVPFTLVNGGVSPQYILATFTSSKTPGVGTANTTLYIDDVSLIYNPSLTIGTISPLLYYVSASQSASVSVPYTATGTFSGGNIFTAQLSNASGSFAAPVSLGTLASTTSGIIAGTIPAGTASGTGYRIRTTSSNPSLTSSANASDIEIRLVSNSIAPSTTQTIVAGTNGTTLNVTESAGVVSREWKYSNTPGGPYGSFAPLETASSYVPNFATSGSYYVVCQTTYPNGIVITSNEVQINVVGNSVAPSGSQSILVSVNGATLTVTESPAGTGREWKYSNTPGGPYSSFGPAETGMAYIPNFAAPGVYYVVCISTISSLNCTSNEVIINVGSATLTTGSIVGSPYWFSANAPNASVNVPYVVSGALNPGNIFTAQLSDASGSFASPVNIGNVTATGSGTISASIPYTSLDGTGYRIRVISSNPAILGSDNGTDLVIDQFDNSVSPSTTQTIMYSTNGTAINVAESQTASRVWKYSMISGGPYLPFIPSETSVAYTPNFAIPATYYVVSVSKNGFNDTTVSNEVQIDVTNGTTLNTSSVAATTFYLSPNAVVTDNIAFTSDIVFNAGNNFTAEISDQFGSFISPTVIGTITSSSITPVPVQIPNLLSNGTGYRIRVKSDNPAAVGTDNGLDLLVVQFENSIALPDTQYLAVSTNGIPVTVSATHPTGVTQEWMYKVGASPFTSFIPSETGISYTPNFPAVNGYYVSCFSVNMWGDTTQSAVVVIFVNASGLEDQSLGSVVTTWQDEQLWINLTNANMQSPVLEVLNMSGQVLLTRNIFAGSNNQIPMSISSGMYVLRITDGDKIYTSKFIKP